MAENQKAYPGSIIGQTFGGQASFLSAPDATLYINGIKLVTTASIAWAMDETRIPLYGYNDRLFNTVTKGRVQIRGTIEVNFLYKGLFELLILKKSERQQDILKLIQENPVLSSKLKEDRERKGNMRPISSIPETDLITFIQDQVSDATLSSGEKDRRLSQISEFLEGKFTPESPEKALAPQILQKPFDMTIFYSNHNKLDPSLGSDQLGRINILSEAFKECYIISKSKTIRAEVGGPDGSGSPIMEVYNFLSRKLI